MFHLNDDVIIQITMFCQLKEIHNILSTNKKNYDSIKYHFMKNIKLKKQYILHLFKFPDIIIDIMNGISTIIFAPILKYQDIFEGSTGYIDQIKATDLPYPIMIGVDNCARPFITFKLKCDNKIFVETLFQRYTNEKHAWTFGTYYQSVLSNYNGYTTNMYDNNLQINDGLLKGNIKLLLEHKDYIYKKCIHKTNYQEYIDTIKKKQLSLCE